MSGETTTRTTTNCAKLDAEVDALADLIWDMFALANIGAHDVLGVVGILAGMAIGRSVE